MKSVIICLLLFAGLSAGAQARCVMSGTVDSAYDGQFRLSLMGASRSDTFDTTIPVSKGSFSCNLILPHYGIYFLSLDTLHKSTMYLLIDSPYLSLDIVHRAMMKTKVRGSYTMQAYTALVAIQERERKLAGKYIMAKMKQPADTVAVRMAADSLGVEIAEKKALRLKYLHQYPASIASAYELLNGYNLENDLDTVKLLFARLSEAARLSPYGLRLKENIANAHLFAIGNAAPDISAKDTSGKVHTLSDYRGKYVLLDYWASWCVPCRVQIPSLQKVYAEYGDKVQIISISINTERDKWIAAIQKDKMDWLNISDLSGVNGSSATAFKIESVPTIYLIGPDGHILSKRLNDKGIYTAVQKEITALK